jgi:hypothetical protein
VYDPRDPVEDVHYDNSMTDPVEGNRALWDELTPIHLASEFYDVESFRAGRPSLRHIEVDELGDVTGKKLLHLQYHFGMDTLSWSRLGAEVTGADISVRSIEVASSLAAELGLEARQADHLRRAIGVGFGGSGHV